MRVKSYYAGTVEAAMCLARQELGEDAMLMNSRLAPEEARHLGVYEVVFAADDDSRAVATPQPAVLEANGLAGEVADIKRQLERLSGALKSARSRRSARFDPWIEEVCDELEAAGVEESIVAGLARKIEQQAVVLDPERTQQFVAQALAESFTVAPFIGAADESRKIVALLGPAGSGKTTALVKLAVRYGLTTRRPTQILTVDTNRIAAAEQLRSYAAILGVGFEAFESIAALARSLEEHSRKELVFIDTPGYSPADMDLGQELARFLAMRPDIDKHLVLSCTTGSSDLSSMVERFAPFHPNKLLFTRLDEAGRFGGILNESARGKLAVSYLSTGQRIPDDLEPASKDRIVELILSPAPARVHRGMGRGTAA